MEIENKTRWHPAFCAVMELELSENRKGLTYDPEHSLSAEPLRILSQAEELLEYCDNLQNDAEYEMAKKIVNLVSDINEEIFEQITSGGDKMSDKLRYMLLLELKEQESQLADSKAESADRDARLADRNANLADSRAEIEKLKQELAEARAANA